MIFFPVIGPVEDDLFQFHSVVGAKGQRFILEVIADLRFNLFLGHLPIHSEFVSLIPPIQF